jgi:Protein of unknown function (DUF1822)
MMTQITEQQPISSYLDNAIHDRAYELAKLQSSPEKAIQVYTNAIAVLAANTYLGWLNFATDLDACESLNPVLATIGDFADLYLPDLEVTLECRIVSSQANIVSIPSNAVADRSGCLVLQIDGNLADIEDIEEVKIIGFTDRLATEISLSSLKSVEEFIGYLEKLEAAKTKLVPSQSIYLLIVKIIALFPQLDSKSQELVAAIETNFHADRYSSFINDVANAIDRLLTVDKLNYDLKGEDNTSKNPELRDILYEILDKKRNQAGIDCDDEN